MESQLQSLRIQRRSRIQTCLPRTGFIAFVESEENWNIWRASIEDGQIGKAERFLASSGQNHSPSFSPDGKTIAFVSDRSGNPEIWLSDADGTNLRQLTHFGGPWLGTIRWSPDGKTLVFDGAAQWSFSSLHHGCCWGGAEAVSARGL